MRALALAAALLLAVPLAPANAPDPLVSDYSVEVEPGVFADGLVGRPVGEPTAFVLILHGYGHKAEIHRGHLQRLAAQGYLAVAMDYRGEGFALATGAADSIAATRDLRGDLPAYLYSVSMGTAPAGMVLAELPGVFEYWVDNEGLSDLAEIWAGATVLAPANAFAAKARDDIERECGGTPAQEPACYAERSAMTRAVEFEGLRGVVLTHGLNDGLVPYDQGRKMQAALAATGVPTEFYTYARCAAGQEGTTLTGYTPLGGQGVAGHGTESNDAHCLTGLSFRLLDDVIAGRLAIDGGEHVVDGDEELAP